MSQAVSPVKDMIDIGQQLSAVMEMPEAANPGQSAAGTIAGRLNVKRVHCPNSLRT